MNGGLPRRSTSKRPRLSWPVTVALTLASAVWPAAAPCLGEEADDDSDGPQLGRVVSLDQLPEAPEALADWLVKAGVSFRIGGQRPSVVRSSPSLVRGSPSLVRGSPAAADPNRVFEAETQFRLTYSFQSRTSWRWRGRDLVVSVKYDDLELNCTHEIWLRSMPGEDFWRAPLVQHELDHVRISSDSRVEAHFEKRVRARNELRLTPEFLDRLVAAGVVQPRLAARLAQLAVEPAKRRPGIIDRDSIAEIVEHVIAEEFEKSVQLVRVRYRELDRITDHGGRPVPTDGPLRQWLTQ